LDGGGKLSATPLWETAAGKFKLAAKSESAIAVALAGELQNLAEVWICSGKAGGPRPFPFPSCPLAFPAGSAEHYRVMPGPRKTSARQRVLAQWRGVDPASLEAASAGCARPVGEVLPRVAKGLYLERRRTEVEIVKVWNSLIDPNIVAHAQPAGIRNGTLFVKVDSSVWLSEIVRYRRKEILNQLQYSFGRDFIQRISFRVG